ncbi:MAG: anti-sigma factor, partial [Afipia sp.]|nr:anti-sigma factor [Afipia sp.]
SAAEFERHMMSDASIRTHYDQIMILRGALRTLPQEDLPPALLSRVISTVNAERSRQRGSSWQAMAASAMIGAVIAATLMLTIDRNNARYDISRQVVSSHIRGLLAPQPFDVASSDRHTVKPWFTTRIPESPQVVDIAAQGFVLVGGRVDVIGRDPVATIVYRRAAHTVSLTTLRPGQPLPAETIAGYNTRSWSDRDFTYVAVSDLPNEDLESFERAFAAGLSR